jgi:ADP-ribose pyrophosphatase YjhB (NUDIX family)
VLPLMPRRQCGDRRPADGHPRSCARSWSACIAAHRVPEAAVLPGGGVEEGKTAAEAALRELHEKTLVAQIDFHRR